MELHVSWRPIFERLVEHFFETFHFFHIQTNLCNLLRARARLVEKQYTLYKLHANYGRVFSEWSAIEKELGDGLQVKKKKRLLNYRKHL